MIEAHVVRDFQIGNTRIKFADNYCHGMTQREVAWLLRRIAERAQQHFVAAASIGKHGH